MDWAAQHRDLMAQHQDLHLVSAITAQHQDHQLQQLTQDQIPERQDHGVSMTPTAAKAPDKTARQTLRPDFRTVQGSASGLGKRTGSNPDTAPQVDPTIRHARRARTIWQYWHTPAAVRAAPTLPGTTRIRLPLAPRNLLRQARGEGLAPPLESTAPHGARPRSFMDDLHLPSHVSARSVNSDVVSAVYSHGQAVRRRRPSVAALAMPTMRAGAIAANGSPTRA
jgi:hypothetical protein